jgi:tetratricopeptide (TPR) repeat protein
MRVLPVPALVSTLLLAANPASAAASPHAQSPPASTPQASSFDRLRARAEAARAAGRLEDAVALYRQATQLRPAWTEGFWYLGTIAYERERYEDCREAFATVVRQQPENGAAWAFRGVCAFHERDYSTALADLDEGQKRGLGDDPSFHAVARYHRALLLARSGQFERALRVYAEFVRAGQDAGALVDAIGIAVLRATLVPDEVPADRRECIQLAGRATIFAIFNQAQQAEAAFDELVRRYPDAPNVHFVYGTFLVRDRPDQALGEFREELRRSPWHAPAMLRIAQELVKRGEYGEALTWARRAADITPEDFVARRVLGQAKLETGDLAGAVSDLEAAARLEPDSPSVHFILARAYQRAGRAADASREREVFTRLERLQRVQRGGAHAVGDADADPTSGGRPPK